MKGFKIINLSAAYNIQSATASYYQSNYNTHDDHVVSVSKMTKQIQVTKRYPMQQRSPNPPKNEAKRREEDKPSKSKKNREMPLHNPVAEHA